MTEYDPLADELRALRPHEPSPELRWRIANRLEPPAQVGPRNRTVWRRALMAGLAAAGLAGIVLSRSGRREAEPILPGSGVELPLAAALDTSLPTLWSYRSALHRSPADLEALLDEHAGRAPNSEAPRGRNLITARFDPQSADLLGEL